MDAFDEIKNMFANMQKDINDLRTKVAKLESKINLIPDDTRFDMDKAAEYLQMPKASLYNKTYKNCIRFHKLGRQIFFYKIDLDNYIQKNTHKTWSELRIEINTKRAIKNL